MKGTCNPLNPQQIHKVWAVSLLSAAHLIKLHQESLVQDSITFDETICTISFKSKKHPFTIGQVDLLIWLFERFPFIQV